MAEQSSRTALAPVPAKRKSHSFWEQVWISRFMYFLLLPVMLGAIIFQYYPALNAFYRSFFSWDGRNAHFIGLYNFRFFFEDPRLWTAWINILQLLIFGILIVLTVPLLVAYIIYRLRSIRLRYIYRVLFVIPIVVPGVVGLILWTWILANNGAINIVLRSLGLDAWTRIWLGNPDTALYALMFMGFPWVGAVTMLIYLAGFMAIPEEVIDASKVDGAVGLRRLWSVELPLVRGQMKLQVMLTAIGTIQSFQMQLIVTNGGPGWATMVPGLRMYQAAMLDANLGYACAIGVILFIIVFTLTLINQRYLRGSVEM